MIWWNRQTWLQDFPLRKCIEMVRVHLQELRSMEMQLLNILGLCNRTAISVSTARIIFCYGYHHCPPPLHYMFVANLFCLRLVPLPSSVSFILPLLCLPASSLCLFIPSLSPVLPPVLFPFTSLLLSLTCSPPPYFSPFLYLPPSLPLWKTVITPDAARRCSVSQGYLVLHPLITVKMTLPLIPTQQPPRQCECLRFCAMHPIRLE